MVVVGENYLPISVFLSLVISFVGVYASILSYEQYRLCCKHTIISHLTANTYQLLHALSLGGVAMWSAHFISLSRLQFTNSEKSQEIMYNVGVFLASLVCVILVIWCGLVVASYEKSYVMDEKDAVDAYYRANRFMSDASIDKVLSEKSSKSQMSRKSSSRSLGHFLSGKSNGDLQKNKSKGKYIQSSISAMLIASGLISMNYIGFSAISFSGRVSYDKNRILGSVVLALFTGGLIVWIFYKYLPTCSGMEQTRLLCSLIISLSINAVHYMCLFSAAFEFDDSSPIRNGVVSAIVVLYIVSIMSALFISLLLMVIVADYRRRYCFNEFIVRELECLAKDCREYDSIDDMEIFSFLFEFTNLRAAKSDAQLIATIRIDENWD